MYFETFRQFRKQLAQIETWFDAAEAHATPKKVDVDRYLQLRLVFDQFPFVKQVQVACDTAKVAASRLSGKEAPTHADEETSIAGLRTRIQSVVAFLDTLKEDDFKDAATRSITQPRWKGQTMTGADYFMEHALPNFYFHLAHSYAILRHNGVSVGKRDYLGKLSKSPPK